MPPVAQADEGSAGFLGFPYAFKADLRNEVSLDPSRIAAQREGQDSGFDGLVLLGRGRCWWLGCLLWIDVPVQRFLVVGVQQVSVSRF